MENQINSKISENNKDFFKLNNGSSRNKFKFEENKNNYKYPNINNNIISPIKHNIYPIISNNLNSNKNNNYINNNRTIFQNQNHFNNTFLINDSNRYNNDMNVKTLDKSSSTLNLFNNKVKKVNICKGLNRNRSTAELLNKGTFYILPAIKPRKIIIDYCCGPYELYVKDINSKNVNYKKYGHNTSFMGEKYNPQNYEIKQINRLSRNYYGKPFAN